MGTDAVDFAIIHYDDPIGVFDRIDPLGNNDRRRSRDFSFQAFTNTAVGFGIDGTGRIIEDQDFRFLQQGTSNRQPLFCPPETLFPPCEICVSYLSGNS